MISRITRLEIAEYCQRAFTVSQWDSNRCKDYLSVPSAKIIELHDFLYRNDFPESLCIKARGLSENNTDGIKNLILSISDERLLILLVLSLVHEDEGKLKDLSDNKQSLFRELEAAQQKDLHRSFTARLFNLNHSHSIDKQIQEIEKREDSTRAAIDKLKSYLQNDGYFYEDGHFAYKPDPKGVHKSEPNDCELNRTELMSNDGSHVNTQSPIQVVNVKIDTGGGAFIAGDVNAKGDFVGRDKTDN